MFFLKFAGIVIGMGEELTAESYEGEGYALNWILDRMSRLNKNGDNERSDSC